MRLDIISEDRLGITEEILTVFVDHGWDLLAMEMEQFHTYVHVAAAERELVTVERLLKTINGITAVRQVRFLPTERKQIHMQSLLSRFPEAVLNIDNDGRILTANEAAIAALSSDLSTIDGLNIRELVSVDVEALLAGEAVGEIYTGNGVYQLESTPVEVDAQSGGIILVLRSSRQVGKQLSDAQGLVEQEVADIIGESTKIKTLKAQTVKFAQLDLPVLIRGETGTGKELLARALHYSGHRKGKPFLTINCATLAENLLESELFGYDSGAFTGAQKRGKPGLFEMADQGTVFLDEIGEMSVYLQAKLLRFLQEYTFRRIGGAREIKVDIRIVCATHRDLESMTRAGQFREDLFYRLNVLNLILPPLRERREDLPLLVDWFVKRACHQVNAPYQPVSEQVMQRICQAQWPGNIRQLQNAIFRAVALDDPSVFDAIEFQGEKGTQLRNAPHGDVDNLDDAVRQFEKALLLQMYADFPSTRKLAKRLGTSHAKIARKLNAYSIK